MWFPVELSNCPDIPEGKYKSCLKYGLAVLRPFIRLKAMANDTRYLRNEESQALKEVRRVINSFNTFKEKSEREGISKERKQERENKEKNRDTLRLHSSRKPFLETPDMYFLFTIETLHNLRLGNSKILKEFQVAQLPSGSIMAQAKNARRERMCCLDIEAVLRVCNFLLPKIQRESGTSMLKDYFCKGKTSSYLKGMFTNMSVNGMLEGKYSQCMSIVFLFVTAFIDHATRFLRNVRMSFVHTKHSELDRQLIQNRDDEKIISEKTWKDYEDIIRLEEFINNIFETICKTGIFLS